MFDMDDDDGYWFLCGYFLGKDSSRGGGDENMNLAVFVFLLIGFVIGALAVIVDAKYGMEPAVCLGVVLGILDVVVCCALYRALSRDGEQDDIGSRPACADGKYGVMRRPSKPRLTTPTKSFCRFTKPNENMMQYFNRKHEKRTNSVGKHVESLSTRSVLAGVAHDERNALGGEGSRQC